MMLSNLLTLGVAALGFFTTAYARDSTEGNALGSWAEGKIIEAVPRDAAVTPYEALCPGLEKAIENGDFDASLHTTKAGNTYTYECDFGFHRSDTVPIYQNSKAMTTEDCLNACDADAKCFGGMLTPDGLCMLSTNIQARMFDMPSVIGFSLLSNATRLQPYETTPSGHGPALATPTKADHTKRCVNAQCYDFEWVCTYSGTQATTADLNNIIEWFCNEEDGYSVGAGTTLSKTGTTVGDNLPFYIGVRDTAGSGSWYMDPNLCKAGFGDLLDSCMGNGGSQGGYIWYYFKDLTFVIGINGNTPTTFCGGDC